MFLAAEKQRQDGAPALYETVLRMGAEKFDEHITIVWGMEGEDLTPTGCRVEKLVASAASLSCICGGEWRPAGDRLVDFQGLGPRVVRNVVVRGLRWGVATNGPVCWPWGGDY